MVEEMSEAVSGQRVDYGGTGERVKRKGLSVGDGVKKLLLLLGPLGASAAVTALLYGGSLSYGFMFDDPLDLPRASGRSYLSIFTSASESSYYRPLILAVWKMLYDLLGRNDGTVLHLLVLVAHAMNAWLVYHIGSRLQGRIGGYLSALLFVSFPLSYQAVANVNAFFHPLVTTFLLCSVVFYWNWGEGRSWVWLWLAVVAGVLAVFTHEYGVMLAALIPAVEVFWLLGRRERRPSPAIGIFFGISAGFLLIWLLMPRWQHTWEIDAASVTLNSLYFFQGLVYPVASQLAAWQAESSLPPTTLLILSGGSVVFIMAAAHFSSRRLLSFGFALYWTIAGVLPALVSLPFWYVIDGPRLLYLSSVGISFAWGGALSAAFLWRARSPKILFGSVSLALACVILVQSVLFVKERDALFVEGSKVVRSLAETALDPRRPGRTYVNFPSWFALKRSDYLLGHTGVIMVPYYIGLGRVAYIQTGEQPEIVSIAYDVIARQWDYHYAAHGARSGLDELEGAFRQGGGVYVTRFYSGSVELEYVGALDRQEAGAQTVPYLADFGGWGRLVSAKVELDRRVADVTLKWAALGRPERDYTMFVHVYGAQEKPIAQADGYPIGDMFPPQRWRPGDLVDDHRRIALPLDAQSGVYRLVLGIYDRQNGQRVPALDSLGTRQKDDGVSIGSITVP